ncbi:acetyltransferase, GNAT family [Winogradskyella sp. PG-2]|nr:acetyltransferase, GNAT family [Winogradskyella sp. PG-2]
MPIDHDFYRERWEAAGVQYNLSYGMFDGDKLVGFIINAIDNRPGYLTAYNSGTGVIPKYRGQRIVKSIYDYAIPELLKNGITKCQLEVITENEKAIKSYEGIGFKKCKHYKCFKGEITLNLQSDFDLKKVSYNDMNWEVLPNQNLYSWDNQKESLAKANFEYYQVGVEGKIQSYFIMNSETGYIAQLEVFKDSPLQWLSLFSAIQSINKDVRINNIDDSLTSKINTVTSAGLKNTVNQYEMELYLK